MRKRFMYSIIIRGLLLFACFYFLWQFDIIVKDAFWNWEGSYNYAYDGWFLGMLRGVDIYNTCMAAFIMLFIGIFAIDVISLPEITLKTENILPNSTNYKAVFVGLLLAVEALLVPFQAHLLATGEMPSTELFCLWFVGALITLITYCLGFLGYEKQQAKKEAS